MGMNDACIGVSNYFHQISNSLADISFRLFFHMYALPSHY